MSSQDPRLELIRITGDPGPADRAISGGHTHARDVPIGLMALLPIRQRNKRGCLRGPLQRAPQPRPSRRVSALRLVFWRRCFRPNPSIQSQVITPRKWADKVAEVNASLDRRFLREPAAGWLMLKPGGALSAPPAHAALRRRPAPEAPAPSAHATRPRAQPKRTPA